MVASMAEQPHVLVVDDDAKIAAALRRALIYEGYQVEVAPDGRIALTRARERMPDLAILDIMMPGIDGLEVTRRLRAEGDVPILLLTAKDGTADRVKGLDSGADDYLVKPFAYEELLARVRALLRRRAPRARRTLRYADVVMDMATREVRRADQLIPTTAKEFDLLQHFMCNPGQVLRREQLLAAVAIETGRFSNLARTTSLAGIRSDRPISERAPNPFMKCSTRKVPRSDRAHTLTGSILNSHSASSILSLRITASSKRFTRPMGHKSMLTCGPGIAQTLASGATSSTASRSAVSNRSSGVFVSS